MSRQRQWRRVVDDLARRFSGVVEVTGKSHLRIALPNGRSVFTSGTPTDTVRESKNTLAQVRRAVR